MCVASHSTWVQALLALRPCKRSTVPSPTLAEDAACEAFCSPGLCPPVFTAPASLYSTPSEHLSFLVMK